MYPYEIIWGMDLYSIMLVVGVISTFVIFRICADRRRFSAKLQNTVLLTAFLAVVLGYGSAVVTQALYNYFDTGIFEVNKNTGATFLGGAIGGAAAFLLIYFGLGALLFRKNGNEHLKKLPDLCSIAGGCIASALGFGRIGCFFAGCCYGLETDGFLGIHLVGMTHKTLPVQLFESGFAFLLFALILFHNLKYENFLQGLTQFMVCYGIWRYFAEFMRGDDRGKFAWEIFTPSQFSSLLLIVGGIGLFFVFRKIENGRKNGKKIEN